MEERHGSHMGLQRLPGVPAKLLVELPVIGLDEQQVRVKGSILHGLPYDSPRNTAGGGVHWHERIHLTQQLVKPFYRDQFPFFCCPGQLFHIPFGES